MSTDYLAPLRLYAEKGIVLRYPEDEEANDTMLSQLLPSADGFYQTQAHAQRVLKEFDDLITLRNGYRETNRRIVEVLQGLLGTITKGQYSKDNIIVLLEAEKNSWENAI